MFRRRIQHGWHRRIRDLFWPQSGWRRSSTYVAHRIGRLPGTPYSIAAGFACGAAVSFTPLIGFHFVLAAMLALIVRGNLLASALGTVVGNPWTFPGIWLATYRLGSMVVGQPAEGLTPERLTLMLIVEQPGQVFFPMMVGGTLAGIVAWFVFFFPVRAAVSAYRARSLMRRTKKARHRKLELEV
jgi:uncharacterized protein (DUF2062 family)